MATIDPGPLQRLAARCRKRAEYPQQMSVLSRSLPPEAIRAASLALTVVADEIDRAVDEGRELAGGRTERSVRIPPDGVSLRMIEREAFLSALEMSGGSQLQAAKLLRISPRRFNYQMARLSIERPCDKSGRRPVGVLA